MRDAPGPKLKDYITPAGLQRLKDEHRFLMNRERPAVTKVVSWAAASAPRWWADGRELFYLSRDSTIVAVPVDPIRTPSESPGRTLFLTAGLAPTGISGQVYDVALDGSRFLLKRESAPHRSTSC